jgi:hypothetical protein
VPELAQINKELILESSYKFTPLFCPHCGQETPEGDNICENCGKNITFSVDEWKTLKMKYCVGCGSQLAQGAISCNECGRDLKLSLGDEHFFKAAILKQEGKKLESIEEAKRALPYFEEPEMKFFISGFITGLYAQLLGRAYSDIVYSPSDDYFPKELVTSQEFKGLLNYAQQTLSALNNCSLEFKKKIESDPNYKIDDLRKIVRRFSKELEKI